MSTSVNHCPNHPRDTLKNRMHILARPIKTPGDDDDDDDDDDTNRMSCWPLSLCMYIYIYVSYHIMAYNIIVNYVISYYNTISYYIILYYIMVYHIILYSHIQSSAAVMVPVAESSFGGQYQAKQCAIKKPEELRPSRWMGQDMSRSMGIAGIAINHDIMWWKIWV